MASTPTGDRAPPSIPRRLVTIYASASTSQWCQQRVQLLWQARVAVVRGVDAGDGVTAYRGKAKRARHWRLKSMP